MAHPGFACRRPVHARWARASRRRASGFCSRVGSRDPGTWPVAVCGERERRESMVWPRLLLTFDDRSSALITTTRVPACRTTCLARTGDPAGDPDHGRGRRTDPQGDGDSQRTLRNERRTAVLTGKGRFRDSSPGTGPSPCAPGRIRTRDRPDPGPFVAVEVVVGCQRNSCGTGHISIGSSGRPVPTRCTTGRPAGHRPPAGRAPGRQPSRAVRTRGRWEDRWPCREHLNGAASSSRSNAGDRVTCGRTARDLVKPSVGDRGCAPRCVAVVAQSDTHWVGQPMPSSWISHRPCCRTRR